MVPTFVLLVIADPPHLYPPVGVSPSLLTRLQDEGGPFAIRYYLYCAGVVAFVISVNGLPGVTSGHVYEIWFLTFIMILNLSFWSYLMGSISGKPAVQSSSSNGTRCKPSRCTLVVVAVVPVTRCRFRSRSKHALVLIMHKAS